MFRTVIKTLTSTGTAHVVWKVQQTWSHPQQTLATTVIESDGTVPPLDLQGHDNPIELLTDAGTVFKWHMSNGVTSPYDYQEEYSDAFTLADAMGYLAAAIPDVVLIDSLSPDTYWYRIYASDGTILMVEVNGDSEWPINDRYALDCFNAFDLPGDPLPIVYEWRTVGQRLQRITGAFPSIPALPDGSFGGPGGTCSVLVRDVRSSINLVEGRACMVRDEILNQSGNHLCLITPECERDYSYSLQVAPAQFSLELDFGNESVAIRCGECP